MANVVDSTAMALVSGCAGRAVVREANDAWFLLNSADAKPMSCGPSEWSRLRSLHPDCDLVAAGSYPYLGVQETLHEAWRSDRAFTLLLIALDAEHARDLRQRALGAAEQLLNGEHSTYERVALRMLSQPLPSEADIAGALDLCRPAGQAGLARHTLGLLSFVQCEQHLLRDQQLALSELVRTIQDANQRVAAQHACQELNLAAALTMSIAMPARRDRLRRLAAWFDETALPRFKGMPELEAFLGTARRSVEARLVLATSFAEENELAQRWKAGDLRARTELHAQCGPTVFRLLLKMLDRPAEAGVLTQQVWLLAQARLDELGPGVQFRAWIYRLTLETARKHRRRAYKRPKAELLRKRLKAELLRKAALARREVDE